jgi:hypothetical protein
MYVKTSQKNESKSLEGQNMPKGDILKWIFEIWEQYFQDSNELQSNWAVETLGD